MLRMATSLGRSGLQDWLIQRISAVVLATYTIYIVGFWLLQSEQTFLVWQQLFDNSVMKYATLLTLLSLLTHSWIGIWTVATDYIKNTWIRLSSLILVCFVLLFYLVWGIKILWN